MMSSFKKVLGSLSALALTVSTVPAYAEGPSLNGFIDFGYNYNFNGQRTNNLRGFDANANSLTLQNAQIGLSGEAKNGIEYGVVVMYGYDASLTHSAGFVTQPSATVEGTDTNGDDFSVDINGTGGNLQIDLQQAHLSMPCPLTGGKVTVGKFATLFGAELIEAKDNFNTSRGFLFNYAIPFTHTGVKYAKELGGVGLTAGVVNGWDNLQDNNTGKTVLFQASKGLGDKLTVTLGGAYGPEQTQGAGSTVNQSARSLVDALVSFNPTDKLSLVFNYDWGVEEGLSATDTANWSGLAVHGKYALSDMFAGALRYENFDDEGSRTGMPQVLHSVTATLECKKNDVISRLEVRQDKSSKKAFLDDKGVADDDSQTTVGVQWIYAF